MKTFEGSKESKLWLQSALDPFKVSRTTPSFGRHLKHGHAPFLTVVGWTFFSVFSSGHLTVTPWLLIVRSQHHPGDQVFIFTSRNRWQLYTCWDITGSEEHLRKEHKNDTILNNRQNNQHFHLMLGYGGGVQCWTFRFSLHLFKWRARNFTGGFLYTHTPHTPVDECAWSCFVWHDQRLCCVHGVH